MFKKICITNRHLAGNEYENRIISALSSDADMIILREKDLTVREYIKLAEKIMRLCADYNKSLILHTFKDAAYELNWPYIHLSLHDLLNLTDKEKEFFKVIGASTHSIKEALLAESNFASYITASHIFETECKSVLKPKGLYFLNKICRSVHIPVYALGGINETNLHLCIENGASGVCMMSAYMKRA